MSAQDENTQRRVQAGLFHIPGMDCAAEEAAIRRALEPVSGITSLRFNLGNRTLAITAPEPVVARALDAVRGAGFEPQPHTPPGTGPARPARTHAREILGGDAARLGAALGLAVAAEAVAYLGTGGTGFALGGMALSAIAIALSGLGTYRNGLRSLRRGRLTITALMSVAATGAFLIGAWAEAAMVMALFAIAERIEARSLDRARNAIQRLLAMAPDVAHMRQPDGAWAAVAAADVPLGAIVRVRPGERIPLDGVVTAGSSAVNQAPITGESIPVDKGTGDPVFAGTVNTTAELQARTTATADDTTLAHIIHAVEAAQSTRAPTQRFVDRFAGVYTPAVFATALAVAVLPAWLLDWTWLQAIYRALVLLVIACPCALVISTPVTVVSALARAAQRGILIKGGVHLEQARNLKAIALDKTGTVTEGTPRLVESALLCEADAPAVFALAAGLASRSDHPVSQAIASGLQRDDRPVVDFAALPGRGVQGTVDGRRYLLGNHRLMRDHGLCPPDLETRLRAHESQGRTVTLLASRETPLALFAVADTLRHGARAAVAELRALGVTPVMLSGDNATTVRSIAATAGIEDARGELLPNDKLEAIRGLRRRYGMTAMAGDGINDAPALAASDIGIAMGGAGTDIAIEAADIVIMNDDPRRIAETIRLSRRTHAVLWQNIVFALGVKAAFLALAVTGSATLWMAVFADMGASLLVVGNGLRLLRPTGTHRRGLTQALGLRSRRAAARRGRHRTARSGPPSPPAR